MLEVSQVVSGGVGTQPWAAGLQNPSLVIVVTETLTCPCDEVGMPRQRRSREDKGQLGRRALHSRQHSTVTIAALGFRSPEGVDSELGWLSQERFPQEGRDQGLC